MKRQIDIETNWIDRLVAYVSPKHGLERLQGRATLMMAGGYSGASLSKRSLKAWRARLGDADAEINPDLATLRNRSRDLNRNNPLALGAINTKVTNVVGTGLRLQSHIDAKFLGMTEEQADAWQANVEREFRLWAEDPNSDAERTLDFYAQQELALRAVFESGDVFALLPYGDEIPGFPYDLRIQLIEADRVCNPSNQQDTDTLSAGVEKSTTGAPVAYHILKTHPGAIYNKKADEWEKVAAFGRSSGRRNVLHLYFKKRPGQTRGVPDLAPVIESLKQLGNYTEGELMAAVVSGMFTVFVKTEGGDGLAPMLPLDETGGKAGDEDYKLANGAIVGLAPGESIETANPGRPNQAFDPFVQAILRQIGVALELPFEILVKHFTASYSAARAALLEAWKYFMARRLWLARNFCQPVYEAWLTEAVARGRIVAPGFLNGDPAVRKAYLGAEWIGPARGQIDELKEIKAAELRVGMGISTLAEETAQLTGGDWEVKHAQRVKESKMRLEAGLDQPANPEPGVIPGDSTND